MSELRHNPLVLAALALLCGTLMPCRAVQTFPPAGSVPSKSVPFNASLRTGSDDLEPTHPRIRPGDDPEVPEQVHLLHYGDGKILVSWVTGRPRVGRFPVEQAEAEMDAELDAEEAENLLMAEEALAAVGVGDGGQGDEVSARSARSVVRYGTAPGKLHKHAFGCESRYSYHYEFPGAWNYTSGLLHQTLLKGLEPLKTVYYKVGSYRTGRWSKVLQMAPPPARGMGASLPSSSASSNSDASAAGGGDGGETLTPDASSPGGGGDAGFPPLRIGLMADVGQTYNSSDTLGHMLEDQPHVIFHVGDLSYGDDYGSNGTLDPWVHGTWTPPPPGPQRPGWGTFQPRWDHWGRLAQPLASRIPYLVNTGNHEVERQTNGVEFGSYTARYPTPHNASSSPSPLFYSSDVGPVHAIFITSYTAFERGSDQYEWLAKDLASVDRSVTPWVVLTVHAPMYNTYVAHFKENECMRLEIEPLLYAHGVDLVFHGHTHAYERSNPVYNNTIDECGPVYITIGDGGNIERLAIPFVDEAGNCPDPDRQAPWEQPRQCVTYQEGQYCPSQQPSWSAFREPSFGHGILTVHNATHAGWEWNRNEEPYRRVSDSIQLVQGGEQYERKCAQRRREVMSSQGLAHPRQQQQQQRGVVSEA